MKAKPIGDHGGVALELNPADEPLLAGAAQRSVSPFRLERILVPVDFSECSKKALQYALPLAREHHAVIELLYVIHAPVAVGEFGAMDFAAFEVDMRASAVKALANLAAQLAAQEVVTDTLVESGSPAVEIVSAARRLCSYLIVISTHGRAGIKRAWLGSVAEHVLRSAPCPVLIVRECERDFASPFGRPPQTKNL